MGRATKRRLIQEAEKQTQDDQGERLGDGMSLEVGGPIGRSGMRGANRVRRGEGGGEGAA